MKNQGFSLLELIISLTIISILLAFAYPNYQSYLMRSRRNDGQIALLDLANRLENYYSEQKTYEAATIGTGKNTDVLSSPISSGGWYYLRIKEQGPTRFSLEAKPQKAQRADKACPSLGLNHLGIKTPLSDSAHLEQCW